VPDLGKRPSASPAFSFLLGKILIRVRAVDPRDGPRADPPRVRRATVGGERGPAVAQAGAVAPATLVPGLPANPEAVARWKAETYPQLRREAAEVGATIYFADEAGVRSEDHAGTTWAAVGRTPVVAGTGDRFAVNLISAVTAKGKLRFAGYDGNLNGKVLIDFCRRLLHDSPGPVFLVLDGHPVHRSKALKAFAASTGGRLRLCFLPGMRRS
jgi:DDE superfamily endonuclease